MYGCIRARNGNACIQYTNTVLTSYIMYVRVIASSFKPPHPFPFICVLPSSFHLLLLLVLLFFLFLLLLLLLTLLLLTHSLCCATDGRVAVSDALLVGLDLLS